MGDLESMLSQNGLGGYMDQAPRQPSGFLSRLEPINLESYKLNRQKQFLHNHLFATLKQHYPHKSDLELLFQAGNIMAQQQIQDAQWSRAYRDSQKQLERTY